MSKILQNKIALVTRGSRGIGRVIAIAFRFNLLLRQVNSSQAATSGLIATTLAQLNNIRE